MFQVFEWIEELSDKYKKVFKERLLFTGLQGSYGRGEANDITSDIDAVVILDKVNAGDLLVYRQFLEEMPENDRACGFISGRQELLNWPKHELFQFEKDTIPVYGKLAPLLPIIEREDIILGVKTGVSGSYHSCCHEIIHGENDLELLRSLYKSAFFQLQSAHYLRTGSYVRKKQELLSLLDGKDKIILEISYDWDKNLGSIAESTISYYGLILEWLTDILNEQFT